MSVQALNIHAGPLALAHLQRQGLSPVDVALVPAAAGGPKGLILTHLDQALFGRWLPQAPVDHPLHLVGASIGAWRMATAMLPDPVAGFRQLAEGYIGQRYEPEPGRRFPSPERISEGFRTTIDDFFMADIDRLLKHPRWHLHVVTSRGRGWLRHPGRTKTLAGFAAMVLDNAVSRRRLGRWLERSVFSSNAAPPLALDDHPTRLLRLDAGNFMDVLQASCSIPFVLREVRDIAGAPTGAHWDGGLIDYHFHWPFHRMPQGLVLYPHFQQQVVPGWLDKAFRSRHRPTLALDRMIVLAPSPEWVARLPGGKLPDRNDFKNLDDDTRQRRWREAVACSERLADEWRGWLEGGCSPERVTPL